ncbi:MAG: internal scaffolding protein [Microviridae sp.]|nr:MAG: internal scaffolding protein [Microviridae sp.]
MHIDKDGVCYNGPFIRTPYNYNMDDVSRETGLLCTAETLTQQQFKEECDINTILKRFGITGHLPLTAMQPMAGDFTGIDDYHSALQSLQAANENFMTLPSAVRERFDNNPQKFVDFCINPANIESVREMNLAPRPAAPTMTEIKHGTNPTTNGTTNQNTANAT